MVKKEFELFLVNPRGFWIVLLEGSYIFASTLAELLIRWALVKSLACKANLQQQSNNASFPWIDLTYSNNYKKVLK